MNHLYHMYSFQRNWNPRGTLSGFQGSPVKGGSLAFAVIPSTRNITMDI